MKLRQLVTVVVTYKGTSYPVDKKYLCISKAKKTLRLRPRTKIKIDGKIYEVRTLNGAVYQASYPLARSMASARPAQLRKPS